MLLEAVQCTQSWHNSQCWELILIKDQKMKEKLQTSMPEKNPAYKSLGAAPLVIAVCGKKNLSGFFGDKVASKFGDWMMYDLGLATQNLCNQAHALGLGTVVAGWFDHVKAAEILEIPEEYELVTLIPVGVPDHKGTSPKRKAIVDFVHENKF